jgi:acetolactate synthase-1/2/3 large subunit
VFCLAGDGGFAYSLGELATLTRQGLKVICIVLNNRSLAWVQYLQRIQFGGRYESVEFPDMDFAKVAEGLGCRGMCVERPDELKGAIAEALRGEEAVVLDVKTAVWEAPILAYRKALEEERREEVDSGGLPRMQRTRGEGEEGGSCHDGG